MRVLVTGHAGYIGAVLLPILHAEGHEIIGLDSMLFDGCDLLEVEKPDHLIERDLRDIDRRPTSPAATPSSIWVPSRTTRSAISTRDHLRDQPRRLRVISRPSPRTAGITRFVFASSCTLYGAGVGDDLLDEHAAFNPVTPYGESKIQVEQASTASPTTTSAPPTCATPPPTGSRRGSACRHRRQQPDRLRRSPPVRCGSRATAPRGVRWCTSRTSVEAIRAVLAAPTASSSTTRPSTSGDRRELPDPATSPRSSAKSWTVPRSPSPRAQAPTSATTGSRSTRSPRRCPISHHSGRSGRERRSCTPTFVQAGLGHEHLEGPSYIRLRRLADLIDSGRLSTDVRWLH